MTKKRAWIIGSACAVPILAGGAALLLWLMPFRESGGVRIEAEIDGGLGQLEGGRHHPVHLVVFVVRGFDGVPLGKAEAGIEVEQRLHQRG